MLRHTRLLATVAALLCAGAGARAQTAQELADSGWAALVKDNDTTALRYFNRAYDAAAAAGDTRRMAEARLKMGLCYYGVSNSMGLEYAASAMRLYRKLETTDRLQAKEGRGKCLQLIATVKARQGKWREATGLSLEARTAFTEGQDTTGYLGIIDNSLGSCYRKLGIKDSAAHYLYSALRERERTHDATYLPTAYMAAGDMALADGNNNQSRSWYQRAYDIADSTGNRQAKVGALLCMARWKQVTGLDATGAEADLLRAREIATTLSDKLFLVEALSALVQLKKGQHDYQMALAYQQETDSLQQAQWTWEKQNAIHLLEVQFDIAEKNKALAVAVSQRTASQRIGYMLATLVLLILGAGAAIVIFLRRINRRDKMLLQTQGALAQATEEQRKLKEQQLQQEIEFRESQLSALTLQMVQKNELLQELKEKLDADKHASQDQGIARIINKGLQQDKEWDDFNTYFEGVNKNFYVRLKAAYPDISPNDLKICALIKMNLSIKEMAAVLNISPDSVKTARYRLRKKLQLNTEDNLTDFLLTL